VLYTYVLDGVVVKRHNSLSQMITSSIIKMACLIDFASLQVSILKQSCRLSIESVFSYTMREIFEIKCAGSRDVNEYFQRYY
jgi:predicted RNA-binding protein with PUA-like domain